MENVPFAELLPKPQALLPKEGERTDILSILHACRPWLDAMAEEPKEGWLKFCYLHLAHGLFPEEAHRPDEKTALAAENLIAILSEAMQAENCPFDPLTDLQTATEAEQRESRIAEEYTRFCQTIEQAHFVTLMRLGRQIMPFDPASHTIGVHNVAMFMGRQARRAGIAVDLALLSAASLSHDIGKFGCRGKDAQRIPYLHYYFTWQYLQDHKLPTIAHVAANHSTWDLEFENLPCELLLLIYADFRVRGIPDENGVERVRIATLAQAYEMIRRKLSNMDAEKSRRYRTVYAKLHDFEDYLLSRGISSDLSHEGSCQRQPRWGALLPAEESTVELERMTFENNLQLMQHISVDTSFDQLLEQARNEKNLHSIRNYLHLYAEYHTYLTAEQKQKLLAFLYELLMHPDGDVRRRAGRMMGQILSNSGPKYRKELPAGIPAGVDAPNLLAFVHESLEVWETYVKQCLYPDLRIAAKHAQRIANSLKVITTALFENLGQEHWQTYAEVLLRQTEHWQTQARFVLMDTLCHLPPDAFSKEAVNSLLQRLAELVDRAEEAEKLVTLRLMRHLLVRGDNAANERIKKLVQRMQPDGSRSVAFARQWLLDGKPATEICEQDLQHLYLSNMESAVHWMVKLTHVDMLCQHALRHPQQAFHTAMHLSNLICVSEHMPVRLYAEQQLVRITAVLPDDQKNELVINLLLALETVREETARFLPRYLGKMICQLGQREFAEALDKLSDQLHSDNLRVASGAVSTLGYLLTAMQNRDEAVAKRILGLLMTGISHFEPELHQNALSTLCRGVFDEQSLSLSVRRDYLRQIGKKLLTLLQEDHPGQLNFFTRAAALNHLYRFMVRCRVDLPPQRTENPHPAAFFPGTFDPFSSGHKRIVEEIGKLGFDVYLAVDEFSWSKRTLPKLLRRQIASICVADQLNVYLFPDEIPINIAMGEDLARLRKLIPAQSLYLAMGSDVVHHASAYAAGGAAAEFDHLLFCREELSLSSMMVLKQKIHGKLQILKLPEFYDSVSSTRIREYVDKNLDISMLVDPIVQSLIYQRGYYLRTPQYKQVLPPHKIRITASNTLLPQIPPEQAEQLAPWQKVQSVTLRLRTDGTVRGWACGHSLQTSDLYLCLKDYEQAAKLRSRVSGTLFWVSGVSAAERDEETVRMLLNELLARAQEHDACYALCRAEIAPAQVLQELGFLPSGIADLWLVDMRSPMVLIQDALMALKTPYRDDPDVIAAVRRGRTRLRMALAKLFPGNLLLSFHVEQLNHALRDRVQHCNGVEYVPEGERRLGPKMCVPFGKILANELVPNTVTKRLEAEKEFSPDLRNFTIREYAGYSPLPTQMRTIRSFYRPIILVDDLLHNGYRMQRLDPLLRQEKIQVERLIVGIMSAKGKDQMAAQGRTVECEYFVPNLRYWQTESLLYPFIGGDSVATHRLTEMLPTINLILPYQYPRFFSGVSYADIFALSKTALQNTISILEALERSHLAQFGRSLTLRRLGEAVVRPRMPDRGGHLRYDLNIPASGYLHDDLYTLERSYHQEEGK